MRMAPEHVPRKFWWELIFITVLLFLLAGGRLQGKHEARAKAQIALAPAVELGAVLSPPLSLK